MRPVTRADALTAGRPRLLRTDHANKRDSGIDGHARTPVTRHYYPNESRWTLNFIAGQRTFVEREMTRLSDPDRSLLLRELDHRIKNELTSAICAISAKAMQPVVMVEPPRVGRNGANRH
jgi:two-component sensor histidine kinase